MIQIEFVLGSEMSTIWLLSPPTPPPPPRVESAAALAHQQGEGARTRRELEATLLEGEVGLREVEEELARCRHAGTLLEERGAGGPAPPSCLPPACPSSCYTSPFPLVTSPSPFPVVSITAPPPFPLRRSLPLPLTRRAGHCPSPFHIVSITSPAPFSIVLVTSPSPFPLS